MEIIIKEKKIKIKIDKKINELENSKIIEIFCIISALKKLEINKGNEYEKANIKITYATNMITKEYINIFNITRNPSLHEFVEFFKKIKEKFNLQNTDTKIDLEEYFEENIEISQEIEISMIFSIKSSIKEIEKEKERILIFMKVNNIDEEVFKMG